MSPEQGSFEEAVILPFPLDRVRPARPRSHADDDIAESTVFSLATGLPIAALRPALPNGGTGTLPPAA